MYMFDKQIIQQLLTLIEHNEIKLALKTWSDYCRKVAQACDRCPYKDIEMEDDCCTCLEAKLRILNLYAHGQNNYEKELLDAARKLAQFRQQPA